MIGFSFVEIMEGTFRLDGERFDRPFRFELDVAAPDVLGFLSTATGRAAGNLTIDGFARDASARGRLELSPLHGRTIRYVLDFTADDGRLCTFDGHKTIRWMRARSTWTTLPGEVTDEKGRRIGTAVLRFSLRHHLRGLLASIRLSRTTAAATVPA